MKLVRSLTLSLCAGGLLLISAAAQSDTQRGDPRNLPGSNAKPLASDKTAGMALLAAAVNGDGTFLQDGAGANTVTHLGPGQYQVDFNRDVSRCTYSATSASGLSTGGYVIYAGPRTGRPNAAYVSISPNSQPPQDSPFYLMVYCIR